MNNKINKNKIHISIFLFAITFVALVLVSFHFFGKKDIKTEVSYEILDENVITIDMTKRWFDENKGIKGEYITTDNEYTYVLITYGETTKPNISMCLEEVFSKEDINVKYSVISNESENEVDKYIPKILLRFKGTDFNIKCSEVPPS